jgi:hypothetical protein
MVAKMNEYGILVGKPEEKRALGRPTRRWVHNIIMDLRKIGWGGMNWIYLAEDRDQWRALVNTVMNLRVPYNTVMNLRVPYNVGKFLSSCTIGGFSERVQFQSQGILSISTSQTLSLGLMTLKILWHEATPSGLTWLIYVSPALILQY